jgi:hypothetical protein
VPVGKTMCEGCNTKQPRYFMPGADQTRRWCSDCAPAGTQNRDGRGPSKHPTAEEKAARELKKAPPLPPPARARPTTSPTGRCGPTTIGNVGEVVPVRTEPARAHAVLR